MRLEIWQSHGGSSRWFLCLMLIFSINQRFWAIKRIPYWQWAYHGPWHQLSIWRPWVSKDPVDAEGAGVRVWLIWWMICMQGHFFLGAAWSDNVWHCSLVEVFACLEDWLNWIKKRNGAELRFFQTISMTLKKTQFVQPSSLRAFFINVLFGLLCSGMWSESENFFASTIEIYRNHWKLSKDFLWDTYKSC